MGETHLAGSPPSLGRSEAIAPNAETRSIPIAMTEAATVKVATVKIDTITMDTVEVVTGAAAPLEAAAPTAIAPTAIAPKTIAPKTIATETIAAEPDPVLAQPGSLHGASGGGGGFSSAVMIFIILFVSGMVIWLLNTVVRICDPNKILVISGRQQRVNGQRVGYRVEFGGQTYCIPIIESVKSMDMRTMPVPIEVTNAYAKGGTPLNIQAIANVKISNDPVIVRNAIERFLDRNPEEIRRVARETLEGNLRGVVATLTPEQLNEDRLEFAERIASDVADDLAKLGLHLDTLKIQSVADDVDYLNSIGRQQIALIHRDAEIAESDAVTAAESVESDCQQQSEVAKTQARTLIQAQENELRRIKADLEKRARTVEEQSKAAAAEARARAEQRLQAVRAELERLRLEADEVLPAEADRQVQELLAKGAAAPLAENAKAAAAVNDMLAQVWTQSQGSAAELFALQQLEMVLKEAAQVAGQMQVRRVNVIDRGDGQTLAGLVNAYPLVASQFLDRVEDLLGIDLLGNMTRSPANGSPPAIAAPSDSSANREV
jgi:flotillin